MDIFSELELYDEIDRIITPIIGPPNSRTKIKFNLNAGKQYINNVTGKIKNDIDY